MQTNQKTKSGFTLIELLVVIAIIALLLAVLIPSLSIAKKKVQAVICRSNLKQWGYVFNMYGYDNESSFPQSVAGHGLNPEQAWILGATLPYYEALDMRMCGATKVLDRTPHENNLGGVFKAWGPFPRSTRGNAWYDHLATGSYGFNEWCADPPPGADDFWGLPSVNAIRKTTDKNAYKIPLAADSAFVDTAVWDRDDPPTNSEHEEAYGYIYPVSAFGWNDDAMKAYAMNRHNRGINMIFVDMHADPVQIKELWRFKWHQEFNTNVTVTWPTWLQQFPEN